MDAWHCNYPEMAVPHHHESLHSTLFVDGFMSLNCLSIPSPRVAQSQCQAGDFDNIKRSAVQGGTGSFNVAVETRAAI
jgi:hypothetical protein